MAVDLHLDPWEVDSMSPFAGPPRMPISARAWQSLVRRGGSAIAPGWLVSRGPADSGQVGLSFDDGPHPEQTPRVLDALARHGIASTFFVVGDRAIRHPRLIERIAREGHAIGIHSYSHPMPGQQSARLAQAEAVRTGEVLSSILGTTTDLYRPPYGWVTARSLRRFWASGLRVILWNVDPRDYARGSVEELQFWFGLRPLKGGDLILLHDDRPLAPRIIPDLVESARRSGLEFSTIDRWWKTP